MRISLLQQLVTMSALALSATAMNAQAAPAENSALDNKAIARVFLDTIWNSHNPEAAANMLAPDYIEHNPSATGSGPKAFIATVRFVLNAHPQTSISFHRSVAEGDMVMLHVHWKTSPTDTGAAAVDIFRIQNGKIVEHWDVIQPVPTAAANPNGMF